MPSGKQALLPWSSVKGEALVSGEDAGVWEEGDVSEEGDEGDGVGVDGVDSVADVELVTPSTRESPVERKKWFRV